MAKIPQVHYISSENFEREVISGKRPFLLLCMPFDFENGQRVDVLVDIAHVCGGMINVGLLEETFIHQFKGRYKIKGSPTFLIFVQGEERGRLLGLAGADTLKGFIAPFLPAHSDRVNKMPVVQAF